MNKTLMKSIAGAIAFMSIATFSGCGQNTNSSDSSASNPIIAAADPSLLPYNFLGGDNKTWKGINIDLAKHLSKELGRTITFESAGFDSIIPGLKSGKYDVALTGMFDTKERQKTVDFIDYLGSKNDFLVPKTLGTSIGSMNDLCGFKVGIPSGALEADMLTSASNKCKAAGKSVITVSEYSNLNATVTALTSSRIQVAPNDSAANAYILAQHKSKLKTEGSYLADGYFAAAFPKKSKLTNQFKKAFAAIIANGTYAKVLEKWGISDRSLTEPTINGATS